MKIEAILISAALPGAQPWKGLRPTTKHMACRDGDCTRTRRAIFYSTSTGANRGENARSKIRKLFHKNEDISRSCGQILLRSFQNGDKCIPLRMVQARGPGKFFSPRTSGLKVGGHDALARVLFARSTFFLLLRSGPLWPKFRIRYMKIEAILIWAALPGAQPWKGLRPQYQASDS